MNNLKKILAAIVVIAMMVTIMVPAFAAEGAFSYSAEAQTLKDLGLYNGISTDTFNPDLGTALDRQTGVVMLLRIFGLEADALALTDADTILAKFTDASTIADWAKKQVAYAVKNGLVVGTTDTTFGPSASLNGKAYTTLILRQLGFTVDAAGYETAPATLAEKGGLTADEATQFASKDLIKNDLVGISFGSLKATDKDGKKVIDTLVADKVVDEAAAKDAGLITETPVATTALDVSTVEGLSSTIVKITLGTDATAADVEAAVKAGITVKDSAGAALEVKSVSLNASEDVRVVTAATKADKYTLTYNGTSYDYVGIAPETDKPEASGTAISKTKNWVNVTFNERLNKETAENIANYSINNSLTVTKAELQDGDMIVKLTTSDQTAGKLYTISMTGITDLDGNVVDTDHDESKFGGTVDTTKLKVSTTAIGATANKVRVVFAEDIDETTAENVANYTIDNGLTVTAAEYRDESSEPAAYQKRSVYLTTSDQVAGKLYTITVAGVQDLSGNLTDADNDTAKFGGLAKPTVGPKLNTTAIPDSNTSVKLTFAMSNSELDETTAETVANYTVDNDLTVTKAELQDDKKSVVLTTSAQVAGKLYTVTVANVTNNFGKVIDADNNDAKFGGKKLDTVGAEVSSATPSKSGDDYYVTIKFSKKVEEKSAEVASNYYFGTALGYAKSAELQADGVNVKVKTAEQIYNTLYTATISNVKSSDGVVVKSDKNTAKFVGVGADKAPELTSVLGKDKNSIVLYFNTNLDEAKAETVTNYVLKLNNANVGVTGNPNTAIYNDTEKTVTLYYTTAVTNKIPFVGGTIYTVVVNAAVTNARGTAQTDADLRTEDFAAVDSDADFKVDYIQAVNDRTFDVYFTDEINAKPADGAIFLKGGVATESDKAFVNATAIGAGAPAHGSAAILGSNKKVLRVSLTDGTKLVGGRVYEVYFTAAGVTSVGGVGLLVDSGTVSETVSFGGSNDELTAAEVDYALGTDANTIHVVFKNPLTTASAAAFVASAGNVAKVSLIATSSGDANYVTAKAATYIEEVADKNDMEYNLYFNKTLTSGNVYNLVFETAAGVKVTGQAAQTDKIETTVAGSTEDHTAPAISTVDVSNDRKTMTVTLNQKVASLATGAVLKNEAVSVDMTKAQIAGLFKFNDDAKFEDGTLLNVGTNFRDAIDDTPITEFDKDAKTIKITLTKALAGTTTPKVELKDGNAATDLAGITSKAAPVDDDYTQFTVGIDTDVPVALSYTVVDAQTITVVFSELLDATKFVAANANGFTVGVGAETITSATLGADGYTVTITGTNFDAGNTTVSYTPGTLTDVAGNALAAVVGHATT